MPVDGGSSSTLGGVVGRKGSTPEHSAWSRDVYLSAANSFTVGRSKKIAFTKKPLALNFMSDTGLFAVVNAK